MVKRVGERMTDLNPLARKVADILEPRVGAIVAQAMVEKQCKGLGISPDRLMKEHLDPLSRKIEHVLVIFGHDQEGVGDAIRALKAKAM